MSDPPFFVPRTSRKRCRCSTPLHTSAACAGGALTSSLIPAGRPLRRWGRENSSLLGGAEFADHKTDCDRLEKSPLRWRLAADPARCPMACPQPLVRPHQSNTGQMAGLFFREFSTIAPEWVSGGISADYGFAQAFKLALCARRINGADWMPVTDSRRPDSPPSRP